MPFIQNPKNATVELEIAQETVKMVKEHIANASA